ncbi:hypothetical protein MHA_0779 [Mannheimia haemolytica PHL213]|nr:hypothetical protein MHH_c02830 [Mannheimia haemolytica M42548]EDN73736.1 hypothetical protein MHA_0779 [Mannheimia haemolytica PHL213]
MKNIGYLNGYWEGIKVQAVRFIDDFAKNRANQTACILLKNH